MSFSDIEHTDRTDRTTDSYGHSAKSTMVGFMRAVAIHSALMKGDTGEARRMTDLIQHPGNSNADGHLWNEYLPNFMEGYEVQYGGNDRRLDTEPGRAAVARRDNLQGTRCVTREGGANTHHLRAAHGVTPSATRFSAATVSAIPHAVRHCVNKVHGGDFASHSHAAATWARHTSAAGYEDQDAHAATVTALEDAMVEHLEAHADLAAIEALHTDEEGRQRSPEEVGHDIMFGFMRPDEGTDAPWHDVADQAAEMAPWHAQDALVRSGAVAAMQREDTEDLADENLPIGAPVPHGGTVEAHYPLTDIHHGLNRGRIYLAEDGWTGLIIESRDNSRAQPQWDQRARFNGLNRGPFTLVFVQCQHQAQPNTEYRLTLRKDHNFAKYRPGDVFDRTGALRANLDDATGKAHGGYDLLCMRPFRQYTMGTGGGLARVCYVLLLARVCCVCV